MRIQLAITHHKFRMPFGACIGVNTRLTLADAVNGSGVSIFGHSFRRPPAWGTIPR